MIFTIFVQSLVLAMSAIGGAMALLPEVARVAIDQQHWTNAKDLAQLASVAQSAPGPNMLLITLVGWRAGGIPGALVATVGFCLPSGLVISSLYGKWEALKNAPWRKPIQSALGALAVGMVFSGTLTFASLTGVGGFRSVVALVAAGMTLFTKLPPVATIVMGAVASIVAFHI
jgi:chromate transporter